MKWHDHSEIEGTHAFLSPSQYHWMNYDVDKLKDVYRNHLAKQKGTELHEAASKMIKLKIPQKQKRKTWNLFVNDALKYGMDSEVPLYFSNLCYGTADAIKFENDFLRIHDLKTGATKASFKQLMGYAALFCLEYDYNPWEIDIELRIYQYDTIIKLIPEPDDICHIADKIVTFTDVIDKINKEEG